MAEDNSKSPINVGARAIFEMRAGPKQAPWDKAAMETRNGYRTRMQEVVNALPSAGYVIEPKPKRPAQADGSSFGRPL